MASKSKTETASANRLMYQIQVPPIREWDKENGVFKPPVFYSTPAWVKYGGKVIVLEGNAQTDDPQIALEFIEQGATVTPDPRPFLQERYARELEEEAKSNPARLAELARYVNETNEWRAEHGIEKLPVEAPNVGRAVSALVMPVPLAN